MALNAVTEKQAIIDLMQKTTVEVTPGGAAKVADFRQLFGRVQTPPKTNMIYHFFAKISASFLYYILRR